MGWEEGWFEGGIQERCLIDALRSAAGLAGVWGAFYSPISICLSNLFDSEKSSFISRNECSLFSVIRSLRSLLPESRLASSRFP